MESAAKYNRKRRIITLLFALLITFTTLPAHAYYYAGSDWGGGDLSLMNGDSLSGIFSNVGRFYIPVGAIICGSVDNLVVNAGSVLIDGMLNGLPAPGYDLTLSSQSDLILNGSISSWKNISLSANSIIINGTISLIEGPSVPIPNAFWLLGSGILGQVGVRRRQR